MTTMLEVAKRAGVSKATVSRVLSGNGYVSQETKDRVFQAIEEAEYRPNLLARDLATKRATTGAGGDRHPVPWGLLWRAAV
ncbi:helix-turn-helix transcriptional regulator [Enterobacter hormaechei]